MGNETWETKRGKRNLGNETWETKLGKRNLGIGERNTGNCTNGPPYGPAYMLYSYLNTLSKLIGSEKTTLITHVVMYSSGFTANHVIHRFPFFPVF